MLEIKVVLLTHLLKESRTGQFRNLTSSCQFHVVLVYLKKTEYRVAVSIQFEEQWFKILHYSVVEGVDMLIESGKMNAFIINNCKWHFSLKYQD